MIMLETKATTASFLHLSKAGKKGELPGWAIRRHPLRREALRTLSIETVFLATPSTFVLSTSVMFGAGKLRQPSR